MARFSGSVALPGYAQSAAGPSAESSVDADCESKTVGIAKVIASVIAAQGRGIDPDLSSSAQRVLIDCVGSPGKGVRLAAEPSPAGDRRNAQPVGVREELGSQFERNGMIIECVLPIEIAAGRDARKQIKASRDTRFFPQLSLGRKADPGMRAGVFAQVKVANDRAKRFGSGRSIDVAVRRQRELEVETRPALCAERRRIEPDRPLDCAG